MPNIEDDRKQQREKFTAMISGELERLTADLTAAPPCLTDEDIEMVYEAAAKALNRSIIDFRPNSHSNDGGTANLTVKKGAVVLTINELHVHLEASDGGS